jgi:hypothetical protein
MRNYEGTVRVRNHADRGITLDKGVAGSTLTAADATKILEIMVKAADERKVGIDRWSLYIPSVNENVKGEQLATSAVKKALKDGAKPTLMAAKFGKPCIKLATGQPTAKSTKFGDDIA